MAGINGINGYNNIYSTASQLPGFGGLASGLDRDSLIEQMTMGTRAKIAKMNQKIDLVKWTQESMRGITDKMYNFTNKYTSFSSSSNLTSSKLFSKSQITPVGENSKYIGISGNATGKNQFSILGVKQMAQNAKVTSGDRVSTSTLTTKPINFEKGQDFSKIAGESITFSTGADKKINYKITIPTENKDGKSFDLSTVDGVKDALNYAISEYNDQNPTAKLNIEVKAQGDKLVFANTGDPLKNSDVTISSISDELASSLGMKPAKDGEKITIACGKEHTGTAITKDDLVGNKTMADLLKGQTLTFDYNGKTSKITFTEEDLYKLGPDGKVDKNNPLKTADEFKDLFQKKMDEAFGKNRIKVELGSQDASGAKALSFKTINPKDQSIDASSVLTLKGGSSALMGGSGALGLAEGASNRVNMSATLANSGIDGIKPDKDVQPPQYSMKINGVDFTFDEKATINDVIKKVNESDAGVTISYQSMADKFVIESKEKGSSGKIEMEGSLSEALFGAQDQRKVQEGQDAIVTIKYDGQDEAIDIIRDSNGFNLEGLEVSIKGEFGYTDGKLDTDPSKAVTFDATIDAQKTVDVVKDMVKDLNELIELVNKELRTKPNRDYQPLTAEQKKEMSEDEIEKWEAKAKEGLLFSDSDLRGLSNTLRFSIPSNLRSALAEVGITVSTEYKDNGKLVLDEEKLKTALEKDPQKVRELFNGDGTKGSNGLMTNIKAGLDRYGSTTGATKGILIERAGSTHAPTSMLKNQMLTQINEYNRVINGLNDRLKNEQDRYIKQFTSLETLISQMNSQSSYFAGMMGGY